MPATQAFRNALHVPTADPAAGRTVTVVTPGDEYVAAWQIAGGIPEAPIDGQLYGRDGQAEEWAPIPKPTAAEILTAIKTVDGAGSGLDADLLDGQHGAWYRNWANLTGVPTSFPPELPIPMTGVTGLDSALAAKADLAYVDSQDALKADLAYVDANLALKADISWTQGELDDLETSIAAKADKSYVDSQDATINARFNAYYETFEVDSMLRMKVDEAPSDGQQYARQDAAWTVVAPPDGGGGTAAATYIGTAAPAAPVAGQMWWDSDSGRLYIHYADANTSQWVEAVTSPVDLTGFATKAELGGYLPLSGGKVSGTLGASTLTVGPTDTAAATPLAGFIFSTGGIIYSKQTGTGVNSAFNMYNNAETAPKLIGALGTSSGYTVLSNEAGGSGILLRPTAFSNTTGQLIISPDGTLSTNGAFNTADFISNGPTGNNVSSVGAGCVLAYTGWMGFKRAGTATQTHAYFVNNAAVTPATVGYVSTSGSATTYNTSSDERLKNVGEEYDPAEAIAVIRADPVMNYQWKATGADAIGWIAQRSHAVREDLATHIPAKAANKDLGEEAEDELWGIDYGRRTPYLWAALTAALDKIDVLEARLAALEAA